MSLYLWSICSLSIQLGGMSQGDRACEWLVSTRDQRVCPLGFKLLVMQKLQLQADHGVEVVQHLGKGGQ